MISALKRFFSFLRKNIRLFETLQSNQTTGQGRGALEVRFYLQFQNLLQCPPRRIQQYIRTCFDSFAHLSDKARLQTNCNMNVLLQHVESLHTID